MDALKAPSSPEAEAAYLSCCLHAGVSPECSPADFYMEQNRVIATAMQAMERDRKQIDLPLLYQQLLQMVKDPPSMDDLLRFYEFSAGGDGEAFRAIVETKAQLRRLQAVAFRVAGEIGDLNGRDPAEYLQATEAELLRAIEAKSDKSVVSARASVQELIVETERRMTAKKTITGISSGMGDLDRYTCGFSPGDYIVLAARPSMGKTALALKVAASAARRGSRVLFHSIEMPTQQLMMRLVSQEARLDTLAVRSGRLGPDEYRRFLSASEALAELPIYIDDRADVTELDILHSARKRKPDIILVDYVGICGCSEGGDRHVARERQISIISRCMKGLAKRLNIPVILLAQLNRENEKNNRQPKLSDLRESGSLEQDADMVLFLHAKQNEDTFRECIVSKNRNGPTGVTVLGFENYSTRFYQMDNTQ